MTSPLVALTIAGTDSGGAAGVAADLTTFAALGVHGACAVTAVTAQDTLGVHRVAQLSADDVRAQVDAVLDDLPVAVVKAGMLGTRDIAAVVAGLPPQLPLVVDPVLVATSGAVLGDTEVVAAYRELVLPRATVVTPNLDEAIRLVGASSLGSPADETTHDSGRQTDPVVDLDTTVDIALGLHALGPAVVLTGGDPASAVCRDIVVDASGRAHVLEHAAVVTSNDHGTGCTFSAALAVALAQRRPLPDAVRDAQHFVAAALRRSARWRLGRGRGPLDHTFAHPTRRTAQET